MKNLGNSPFIKRFQNNWLARSISIPFYFFPIEIKSFIVGKRQTNKYIEKASR
jgi:hypothetical protein